MAKTYEELLADLDAAQKELGADSVSVKQPSPGIEALLRQFGPQLSNLLISSTLRTPPPTVNGTKHFWPYSAALQ